MKANKIIALLVAIVLTFAITSPAEAQFGNLLNKAKNSVQKKIEQGVKDRAERAAERAVDNAIDKAEQHVEKEASKAVKKASKKVAKKTGVNVVESSSSSSPIDEDDADFMLIYKKKFKPSKEALAANQFANSDEVPEGFTKSYKELYATFEHLEPSLFPLQPYYKYPTVYALGQKRINQSDVAFSTLMKNCFTSSTGLVRSISVISLWGYGVDEESKELISEDGQKLAMQMDDAEFRYAWAALFFADPNSWHSVWNLAMLLVNSNRWLTMVKEYEVTTNTGIADATKGWMFPYEQFSAKEREGVMKHMARQYVDIELIARCVLTLYQKVESDPTPYRKALYMFAANELYNQILKEHKDFSANASKFNQQTMLYARYNNTEESRKIIDDAQVEPEPPTMTLKPGAMNKQLNAQILKIMKQKDPDVIRVVVISDSWTVHSLKDRSVMAWAVYRNKKGKLEAHDYSFCQDYMGAGKYGSLRYKGIGTQTVYVK